MPKPVKIVMEFDNGKTYTLEGKELEVWYDYVENALIFAQLHGFKPPREFIKLAKKMSKVIGKQ